MGLGVIRAETNEDKGNPQSWDKKVKEVHGRYDRHAGAGFGVELISAAARGRNRKGTDAPRNLPAEDAQGYFVPADETTCTWRGTSRKQKTALSWEEKQRRAVYISLCSGVSM